MRRARPPRVPVLAVSMALLGVAVAAVVVALALQSRATPVSAQQAVVPGARVGSTPVPVELEIPAIGVRSRLVPLATDGTGALQAPDDPAVAGWFAAGVVPGETGPSVIGGHVDSKAGPGIFHALGRLAEGDRVTVRRSDGQTFSYRVSGVIQTSKARFPTQLVYGPTPGPELRLVTCGGRFDRDRSSYVDNIVVEAVLT